MIGGFGIIDRWLAPQPCSAETLVVQRSEFIIIHLLGKELATL